MYTYSFSLCVYIYYIFLLGNGGPKPVLSSEKHLECRYKCCKISKTLLPITVS